MERQKSVVVYLQMQLTRGRNKVRNIYAQGTPNATDNFASPHPTAVSSNIHRLRHHLLLLGATLLVLGSRLREDDGGASPSVAMLLLHPPGLCRSSLGGLVVDVHLCRTIRSPLNQICKDFSRGLRWVNLPSSAAVAFSASF